MACKCSSLLSLRVSYAAAGAAAALLGFWTSGQTQGRGQGRGERRQADSGGALVAASCVFAKGADSAGRVCAPAPPRLSAREQRFLHFASVRVREQLYLTPRDFLLSISQGEPQVERGQVRIISEQEAEEMLSYTPPIWKNSSRLFRNLEHDGLISYTEYIFLQCILTKPRAGFKLAFDMLDTDGNKRIDKKEFLVLEEIFRKKNEKRPLPEGNEESAQLCLKLYGYRHPNMRDVFCGQWGAGGQGDAEGSGEGWEGGEHSCWDAVRHGAGRLFFPGLAENPDEYINVNTTLLIHLFGKKGKAELNYTDFYNFMDNLQTEVLELEFLSYSKGLPFISEEDFARALLCYTDREEQEAFLKNLRLHLPAEKGISFEEFCAFFQFLNNLEDFTIAMQMYTVASNAVNQEEFQRAVQVTTGHDLSPHLVRTVFTLFDNDGDNRLAYREFLGVIADRQQRGLRVYKHLQGLAAFKSCVRREMLK
uniref:calcium uptake protein 3, mitochondrial isoform X1 n=1 Tax=Myxine glutinosa TaxID=7769 RepID=UPI00358F454E